MTYNAKPLLAIKLARSWFLSPKERETSALIPTPVPVPMAIIRFCAGNARETAVKAFSLICATNILSTMLYNACTSIEIIMGNAMEINSLLTGITPILFS